MNTRTNKSFMTAAARRRQHPIIWEIDGKSIHFRSSVDLTDISEAMTAIDQPQDEALGFAALKDKKDRALEAMRIFVEPESLDDFNAVAPDIDLRMLIEDMLLDLLAEYTGAENPTQASPSSDGSSETGASLTAGAEPEA